jgi:guanylate kinase
MSRRGILFVISAPSGAGKTTLCRRLLRGDPRLQFSVSHTTRPRRPGERHGRDYWFVGAAEFDRLRRRGEFVEWAIVNGITYGTSARMLRRAAARGRDLVLDIDTQGAANIRRRFPDAVLIFILPPGPVALRRRLAGRGTEGAVMLARRLRLARREVGRAGRYDYLVVNERVGDALRDLRAIVAAERCRRSRAPAAVAAIRRAFRAAARP